MYQSCPYPGELKEGDIVYVVYAVYSTGNSFGHQADGSFEFISVHKDETIAHDNARGLKEGTQKFLKQDDGTETPYTWYPWDGYFESLTYIQVESQILDKKKVSNRY